MSRQLAKIPNDERIIECAPGTRQIAVARLAPPDQVVPNVYDATGPTVIMDVVELVKHRKGQQVLWGAYYAPHNTWFIAI